MKKTILKVISQEVTSCYNSCHFFHNSTDGMYCNHPHFDDKDVWDCYIISQENSHGRVPDDCPLKNYDTEITHKIKIKNK